jgi:cancer susceptibility candidate protein 1
LACESKPDATVEGDINAFINSWLHEEDEDIHAMVKSADAARQVVLDLIFLHAEARALKNDIQASQCAHYIQKIITLTSDKIEFKTAHILQYADEYLELQNATSSNNSTSATTTATTIHSTNHTTNKGEVKVASASGLIKVGIWVNLMPKGLRTKRIDFGELDIVIEVPKPVVMQALALRVTYLPYDCGSKVSMENLDVPLGGVFSIDLLKIPPPPKRARGWIMRGVWVCVYVFVDDCFVLLLCLCRLCLCR